MKLYLLISKSNHVGMSIHPLPPIVIMHLMKSPEEVAAFAYNPEEKEDVNNRYDLFELNLNTLTIARQRIPRIQFEK